VAPLPAGRPPRCRRRVSLGSGGRLRASLLSNRRSTRCGRPRRPSSRGRLR
jgi:hypothetical protein